MPTPPASADGFAILLLGMAAWLNRDLHRSIDFLDAQLRALMEAIPRLPRLDRARRRELAVLAQRINRARLEALARIVTVDTLRRWYRHLVALKWTYPAPVRRGRPSVGNEVVATVLRMATENPSWGARSIADRLRGLRLGAGESTVARILRDHGIDPSPARDRDSDWSRFLAAHADGIAALDFTTVECLVDDHLVTQRCLFAIHHDTRRVELVGITEHPDERWMAQQARNLTADGGFLSGRRFAIMDRDGAFCARFRHLLESGGVEAIRTPPRSPNCNAFMERFFRSLKEECLSRVIPLGVEHLRRIIGEYLAYYHTERPHQGLGGTMIEEQWESGTAEGEIRCRERLGGILKYYYREAA